MDPNGPGAGMLPLPEIIEFLLFLMGFGDEECIRTFPDTRIHFDIFSQISEVEFDLTVERGIDKMRTVLDPQHWAVCSPDFWNASYVVAEPTAASLSAVGDPTPLPSPPVTGSEWHEHLFEHVVVDWGGPLIQFKVILKIDSVKAALTHDFDYDLKASIESSLGPIKVDGGIDVDKGTIELDAMSVSDPTEVAGSKSFRISGMPGGSVIDFFANIWAAIALQQMGDEAYEAVCCDP